MKIFFHAKFFFIKARTCILPRFTKNKFLICCTSLICNQLTNQDLFNKYYFPCSKDLIRIQF